MEADPVDHRAEQLGDSVGEALVELIRVARANDVVVTVGVLAACEQEMRERLAPTLREAHFFFPNERQPAGMTGTEDPAAGAARLRELGIEAVVGTLGGEGSLILGPGGEARVPAFDIDLVDTTGCGDAYVAGFIVATANGRDPEAAGRLGAATPGSSSSPRPSTSCRVPEQIAALARTA